MFISQILIMIEYGSFFHQQHLHPQQVYLLQKMRLEPMPKVLFFFCFFFSFTHWGRTPISYLHQTLENFYIAPGTNRVALGATIKKMVLGSIHVESSTI